MARIRIFMSLYSDVYRTQEVALLPRMSPSGQLLASVPFVLSARCFAVLGSERGTKSLKTLSETISGPNIFDEKSDATDMVDPASSDRTWIEITPQSKFT